MSSTDKPIRVRFAPSPTGYLHIGGMRSALFNWLWARHNGGVFVLRLEDTDRSRLVEGSDEQIYASHFALGIVPDEGPQQGGEYGPYIQSERLDIYHEHAEKLLKSGALYPCWCSTERLSTLREQAQKAGVAFKYDRHCLSPGNQRSLSKPHVLRFRIPDQPTIVSWDDAVRGRGEVRTDTLDDFVAVKADGFPTYHFAHVVDDHLMRITHIMRADEWIPSTPKHLLLFAAFGWEPPIYAHLPAILGPSGGKKLSKRDGAKSLNEYLDEGYLPEALRSFLASLGWNDGTTQEIYTTEELIERFTLDRIQKSPAKFDVDRLTWMNGAIIRNLPLPDLRERSRSSLPEAAAKFDDDYITEVLRLVQDRLKFLSELPALTDFFFSDPQAAPELLTAALDADTATTALKHAAEAVQGVSGEDWADSKLEQTIRPLAKELGLKTGQFFGLLRVALTGRTAAPGLFETMAVLGRDTTLRRLSAAALQIQK
jgi:glutamyl-tRNA synthetase